MNTINEQNNNPFKGLHFYKESDSGKFYGRTEEKENLYEIVRNNELTVIIGKSGIGKTSLINAGLFPRLRKCNYFPIRLRLNYSEKSASLIEQAHQKINAAIDDDKIILKDSLENQPPLPIQKDETLWEYFRRVCHYDPQKEIKMLPVLVFDQFEEFFTRGKNHEPEEKLKLINELYWVIEDQIPKPYKDNLLGENKTNKREDILDEILKVRIVLSLREDYLPQLGTFKSRIPSIDRNIFRVRALNGVQAREVITRSGCFRDEKTIGSILSLFYPNEYREGQIVSSEKLEIEPAFLSLLCYQLYKKKITRDLIEKEEQENILLDFYESEMKPFPDKMHKFIEFRLLTEGGFRTLLYLEPNQKYKKHIDKLIELRILRKSHDGNREYIEIIHDVLVPIIKKKRDNRLAEKKREELKKEARRYLFRIGFIVAVLVAGFFIWGYSKVNEQYKEAQINRLTAEALVEFPRDNAKAIRIAHAAYEMGQPQPPERTVETLSTIAYSSPKRPFPIATLQHDSEILHVAYSPDGQYILTGSEDGQVKLLNRKNNAVKVFDDHKKSIMSIAFSPTGRHILTGSYDKKVTVRSLDGNVIAKINHDRAVSCVSFSPDGNLFLSGDHSGTLKIFTIDGKKKVSFKAHQFAISSARFVKNGTRILTFSWDKTAKLFDTNGKLLLGLKKHERAISNTLVSFDNNRILTTSEGKAFLWNMKSDKVAEWSHTDRISGADISLTNQIVTTANDGSVQIHALNNGQELASWVEDDPITCTDFAPDGRKILIGFRNGKSKLKDLEGNDLAELYQHGAQVNAIAFSPDYKYAITASDDGTSRLSMLESPFITELNQNDEIIVSATFAPNREEILVLTKAGALKIWNISKKQWMQFKITRDALASDAFYSPDGKHILAICTNGTAKIFNSDGRLKSTLDSQKKGISKAKFTADGKYIIADSIEDRGAVIWTLGGKERLHILNPDRIIHLPVVSPNGKIVSSTSADGLVRLLNLETGEIIADIKHNRTPETVSFSPDSKLLHVITQGRISKLYNAKGKALIGFRNDEKISSAVFLDDSQRILSISEDNVVKLWSIDSDKPLKEFQKDLGRIASATLSPDNNNILVATKSGYWKLIDLKSNILIEFEKKKENITSITFSTKGNLILSSFTSGTVKFYQPSGKFIADLHVPNLPLASAMVSNEADTILTLTESGKAALWKTPTSIYNYLGESKVLPNLTEEEKDTLGI